MHQFKIITIIVDSEPFGLHQHSILELGSCMAGLIFQHSFHGWLLVYRHNAGILHFPCDREIL